MPQIADFLVFSIIDFTVFTEKVKVNISFES